MDSGERLKQMQKEKKLMEWLASTKTKSNNSSNSQENSNNKNTIFEIRKQLIQYRKTKAQETKANKSNYIKLKSFCTAK